MSTPSDEREPAAGSAYERSPAGPDDAVARSGRLAINEDWAATIAGLLLLVAVLAGVLPGWLVP